MEIMEIKGNIARSLNPEPLPKPVHREVKMALPDVPEEPVRQSEEDIHALAEKMNQSLQDMRYSLQFVPDMESGQVVIKVLDGDGKIIRRIPPEFMAQLAAKVGDSTGLVVNETLE
jgi:uncharacterized FlaG/YvyC family protein